MIKRTAFVLMIFSSVTIVISLLVFSVKVYSITDLLIHKERHIKSEVNETIYQKGFSEGFYFGTLYVDISFILVLVLIIVNNINISVRIYNYLQKNNIAQLKKSLKLSSIPIITPLLMAGIPLAVFLKYLIKKSELKAAK